MLNHPLAEKIAQYIQARAKAKLEKFDKEAEKQRKELLNDSGALDELNLELSLKRIDEEANFKSSIWLTDAATRAKQINFATHPLKFTHSDAKGSSIYFESTRQIPSFYLSTDCLLKPQIDVVGNAAALDVASLLQLDDKGVTLIAQLAKNDVSALASFAENAEQLAEWVEGFKAALANKELGSHRLAKQLYFPVADGQYHLISPLYASSLSQILYRRIADTRYTDVSKVIRKAKKEEKYNAFELVDYRDIAIQTFGGTKPQNVSQLNSNRSGKSFLLNSQPPLWTKRIEPPKSHKEFVREYERRVWRIVKDLKAFLISIADKDSTKARRDQRGEAVDELISRLLEYACEIRNNSAFNAGWSAESKLTLSEQLWLDPRRNDAEFQRLRAQKDWHEDIAEYFSTWLNFKLKDKKLEMKDTEYHEWLKLLQQKLALFRDDLQVQREDDIEVQKA